jgi:protein gp37
MGEKTEIAWCDHTFNGWIGCQKVSAGCDNCYAETLMDKRYHKVEWGPHGERKRTSEANWKLPFRWAKAARASGRRPKVFCSSLADVFDNQVDQSWRIDLFDLIDATEELDWLLLTKRPENVAKMLPTNWRNGRDNVWLGTTCEDQAAYDRRWPILMDLRKSRTG